MHDHIHAFVGLRPAMAIADITREKDHNEKTFKEEYIGFLKKFEVEYNEKYLFEWYD